MKNKLLSLVGLLAISGSVLSVGTKTVEGKITNAGTHLQSWSSTNIEQQGIFYFYMDELPGACNSTQKRIAITTDHPLFSTVVSIALTANAKQATVLAYYVESCNFRSDAWDFGVLMIKSN